MVMVIMAMDCHLRNLNELLASSTFSKRLSGIKGRQMCRAYARTAYRFLDLNIARQLRSHFRKQIFWPHPYSARKRAKLDDINASYTPFNQRNKRLIAPNALSHLNLAKPCALAGGNEGFDKYTVRFSKLRFGH